MIPGSFIPNEERIGKSEVGADDEEVSEGGIPWVIILGYDGLPIQPVAPPSPDYIPGPEDPHTPPVPLDEDEREPMFVHAHDLDYVLEPIYPEYIPLEDEHEFPAEESQEYEDDETKDCLVDYPMNGGDDGDDDNGDSSREEDHLALADSAVVIPTDEPVSPPEGTELAEVERLLAMTTPSPSPLISLSPPSAGERLIRCIAPPAHSSPPPVPSPLLPLSGCPTQIQTLKITSTQALIDVVTIVLPSPPLPPLLPSLYIPPPVDRRDDIPESEQPPRKRLCLSILGSRYEVGESSTARPTRDPAEAVLEIAPMTVEEVNTRVTKLAELHKHDTHDLYALLEDAQDKEEAYASREAWAHSIGLSQATHQELQTHRDHVYAHETHLQAHQTQLQLQGTLIQTQHQVLGADGRDPLCDERHEVRDGRHADRVASTAKTEES
ncbi:hypothetical protein Tco_0017683 [Tanacetum coccineum]